MISMTIHAGHAPSGGIGCGAVGYLDESKEAREVVRHLKNMIQDRGHIELYEVTVNNNMPAKQVLELLTAKINSAQCNINLSIHLNAGGGCRAESWCYSAQSDSNGIAEAISKEIATRLGIGWKKNQYNPKLYVLRHTKFPVCIIECTFVDNKEAYDKWDAYRCAQAIADAVYSYLNLNMNDIEDLDVDKTDPDFLYKVQMGAFKNKSNAEKLKIELERNGYSTYIKKEEV